jgi:hypothetical protein
MVTAFVVLEKIGPFGIHGLANQRRSADCRGPMDAAGERLISAPA